jgi:site-specific DNA-methyltransferase (adenine-specific)
VNPYYERGGAQIYLGDCRGVLEPASCDLVLADPPYGETSLKWDRRVPDWPAFLKSRLQPWGSLWVFGSLRALLAARDDFRDWKQAQEIIWEKQNGSNFHSDRFRRVHEIVVQFYDRKTKWRDVYRSVQTTPTARKTTARRKKRPTHTGHIDRGHYVSTDGGPLLMRSVLCFPNCHGYAVHPTQKPIDLLQVLLRYSLRPGGVVLDPFMGSGSTLVAAAAIGEKAVGIDCDERLCEIAARRLDALFAERKEAN